MRPLLLVIMIVSASLQASARGYVEPAHGIVRATTPEAIAAARKCPFLTRWSEQWRKCVWRLPSTAA